MFSDDCCCRWSFHVISLKDTEVTVTRHAIQANFSKQLTTVDAAQFPVPGTIVDADASVTPAPFAFADPLELQKVLSSIPQAYAFVPTLAQLPPYSEVDPSVFLQRYLSALTAAIEHVQSFSDPIVFVGPLSNLPGSENLITLDAISHRRILLPENRAAAVLFEASVLRQTVSAMSPMRARHEQHVLMEGLRPQRPDDPRDRLVIIGFKTYTRCLLPLVAKEDEMRADQFLKLPVTPAVIGNRIMLKFYVSSSDIAPIFATDLGTEVAAVVEIKLASTRSSDPSKRELLLEAAVSDRAVVVRCRDKLTGTTTEHRAELPRVAPVLPELQQLPVSIS